MRWRSWLYIILAEVLSAGLTAAVGLLANVLTNEQHPKTVVIIAIITFALSSGIMQAIRYGIAEKKSIQSDGTLRDVAERTREILGHQQETGRNRATHRLDEKLKQFPGIFQSWIKEQWAESPDGINRVLDALSDPATNPSAVVLEWQQHSPQWLLSLDWRALLVAGELANAYGAGELSSDLFLSAVRAGAPRGQYCHARAALLMKLRGDERKARETLTQGGVGDNSADRFARIVYHFVSGDNRATLAQIDSWSPEAPVDILWASAIQIALISGATANPSASDYHRAATIYRNTARAIPQSASIKIGLASVLINLARMGTSLDRHSDLEEAFELSVNARDLLREQRASSVSAVELASQAAYIDRAFSRVIQVGTPITGEATLEEAASDVVKTNVALAALARGLTDISSRLIPEIEDPFNKAFLLAASAEVRGSPASDLWHSALAQARDPHERVQALLGLARAGATDLPGIEEIGITSPRDAALIRAVAAAVSGDTASALRQLRTLPGGDLNAVAGLASIYVDVGNVTAAVEVLREGAHVLNEPALRLEAARLLWDDGEKGAAKTELEQLLIDFGSNDTIRHDCLAYLGQWAADQKDWVTAQRRFQDLLVLDQNDQDVRWGLILILLQRGLTTRARQIYDGAPSEPVVTRPDQAPAWMAIKADGPIDDPSAFVEGVMDLAERFSDHEFVQAAAIFIILSPSTARNKPLPPDTQARFNGFCERFFTIWPNSSRIRRVTGEDIQQLRSQMDQMIRPSQDELKLLTQVADQLARNVLPWAFLSAMTGRPYSELVIVRAAGIIPARSIDAAERQMCLEAASSALDNKIVLDISAGAAVLEIPPLVDLLMGQFESITVTEAERLDATNATNSLRGRSTSTWVYDEQSDRGRIVDITETVANQRYEKSTQLVALFERCRVSFVATSCHLDALAELAASSWATAIECAAQSGAGFWCDDIALRALARSIGVSTFSTPALIEVLAQRGIIDPSQEEAAIRSLVKALVGDFPLDVPRLSTLVDELPDAAGPVASIFSRISTWAETQRAYEVWCLLIRRALAKDRAFVADWVYAAVVGIGRPQRTANLRKEAAALLLSVATMILADTPEEVSRCVVAARAGLTVVRRGTDDDDPLVRAAQVLRASMAQIMGLTDATRYVSNAYSRIGQSDRQKVLQALYS